METEYQVYFKFFETVVNYLIPMLAVNFMTDVSSRFISQEKKFYITPIVCIIFAFLVGYIYGYIEEESFKDTVEHTLTILTLSGVLFISGAYNAIKNRLVKIIKKYDNKE